MSELYHQDGATYPLVDPESVEGYYYLVGASGTRYYVSPNHDGVGVMLIDREPQNHDPKKKMQFRILDHNPPTSVTIGKSCVIPSSGEFTEPIQALVWYRGSTRTGFRPNGFSHVARERRAGAENPIVRVWSRFDDAIEKAQRLGQLASER